MSRWPWNNFARRWTWPIVLGLLSAIGLAAGLVADGAWDLLSWVALAAPLAAAVRFIAWPV